MFERKVVKKVKRVVWRISASNPEGVLVSACGRPTERAGPVDGDESGYGTSSMELENGSDIIETAMDTLPGELVDAFLKADR